MTTAQDRHRKHQCSYKVKHDTLEEAQTIVDQLKADRIYDQMVPRAYQCNYCDHWHVGHSMVDRAKASD